MRKLLFAVILLTGMSGMAQVTFDLGVRSGMNIARFTQNENTKEKYNSITDFYIGGYGALNFTKVYTLQPEINYSRQGTEREFLYQVYNNNSGQYVENKATETIKVSYLTVGVINKFKFNRFNIHLGPSIDIKTNDRSKDLMYGNNNQPYYYNNNLYYDDISDIDLAFTAGFGVKIIENFGLEARIKKGIVPVDGDWDSTNILYQVGLTYNFNLKK